MDAAGIPAPHQDVLALEPWEPQRQQPGASAAPVLAIDGFEGPLDWLLDLARTRRIDLARLSIVALIQAFEEALAAALAADGGGFLLARWGRWLVMAADLTLLRSRLLLPGDAADAQHAREVAEQLRQRLLARAAIGQAADWLAARTQLGRDVFGRGQPDAEAADRAGQTGGITALLRACLAVLKLPDAGAPFRVPGPAFWSVLDAATRMRALLPTLGEAGQPLEGFLPAIAAAAPQRELRCRAALAGTLLAALELTREGNATLAQDGDWGPILVTRSERRTEGDALPSA